MAFYEKITTSSTVKKIGRKTYARNVSFITRLAPGFDGPSIQSGWLNLGELEDLIKSLQWTAKDIRRGEKAQKRLEAKSGA